MIGTSSSGFFRLARRDRRRHRGQRVQDAHLQRLVTAAAGDDAELHPLAGLQLRRPGRQGVLVHEDVRAVLAREEAETLLRVEPLDLAGGHVGSLSPRCGSGTGPGDDGGRSVAARSHRLAAAPGRASPIPPGHCP